MSIVKLRKHPAWRLFLWVSLFGLSGIFFTLAMQVITSPNWLVVDDFVEYWAAGRLNLLSKNPYDPAQLEPLQLGVGRSFGVPVMMWNPPWMLILAMPFGALPYALSRVIWLLLHLFILLWCVDRTWVLYNGPFRLRGIAWLIGLAFIPALDGLRTGQTGILVFLGAIGFIYFQKKGMDWFSGCLVALIAIKPHILYLFGLAIILWVIRNNRWGVLMGASISLVITTAFVWIINPSVLSQYIYAIQNYPPEDWATPTLGGIFRYLFGPEVLWLQFAPMALGIIWFVFYSRKHLQYWDWLEVSPALILGSVFTAAYGWTSDQVVLLLPIIQIFLLFALTDRYQIRITIIMIYALILVGVLLLRVNQLWLWWLSPSLLIWYGLSQYLLKRNILLDQPTELRAIK